MLQLSFRKATSVDGQAIADIHNANVRGKSTANPSGFLLAEVTKEEILQKLERGVQYFVAVSDFDEILGFVAVSVPKVDSAFLERVLWQEDTYKSKIAKEGNIYIQVVAVKSDYMSRGIAQFLYKSLYEQFPDAFFTTFIASKPIANERSLAFHKKQGFQPIGVMRHEQLLDLKNYESILLLKEG